MNKKFAQLGFEPLRNTNKYNKVLHRTGYTLDPSLGNEETRRFKQANHHLKGVGQVWDGYTIDTTGHSLGGQLAKHVYDSHKGCVHRNVTFSQGYGLLEPFRHKQDNTVDVSSSTLHAQIHSWTIVFDSVRQTHWYLPGCFVWCVLLC